MNFTTCLWSPDNNALEMAEYYVGVFSDSRITTKGIYNEANPHVPGSKAGDIMMVEFILLGSNQFATLNGGPYFKHSCAVSFMIPCRDQVELDYYYDTLSAVPEGEQCGWVTDKFGVSWQLIPARFTELMKNGESEKKSKLMKALLEMKRLTIADLEKAYNS